MLIKVCFLLSFLGSALATQQVLAQSSASCNSAVQKSRDACAQSLQGASATNFAPSTQGLNGAAASQSAAIQQQSSAQDAASSSCQEQLNNCHKACQSPGGNSPGGGSPSGSTPASGGTICFDTSKGPPSANNIVSETPATPSPSGAPTKSPGGEDPCEKAFKPLADEANQATSSLNSASLASLMSALASGAAAAKPTTPSASSPSTIAPSFTPSTPPSVDKPVATTSPWGGHDPNIGFQPGTGLGDGVAGRPVAGSPPRTNSPTDSLNGGSNGTVTPVPGGSSGGLPGSSTAGGAGLAGGPDQITAGVNNGNKGSVDSLQPSVQSVAGGSSGYSSPALNEPYSSESFKSVNSALSSRAPAGGVAAGAREVAKQFDRSLFKISSVAYGQFCNRVRIRSCP